MASQPVATAHGDNRQCGVGVAQRTGYFIDGAVAANRYAHVDAGLRGFQGQFGCMTAMISPSDVPFKKVAVEEIRNRINDGLFVSCAGYRVGDEQ